MRAFFILFWVFFAVVVVFNLAALGTCILSGDTGSMACWLISDRVEIGIRQR
jgi:hypothetical protein